MNSHVVITEEIFNNISKYIENAISTHLHLSCSVRNIVSEDVLFDYDAQFNLLISKEKKRNTFNGGKLTDLRFMQKIQEALNPINVKIYFSNSNTYNYWFSWNNLNSQNKKAIFYTNTNLIIEINNILPLNGSSASLRVFTEDKNIDFIYGHFIYDGTIVHTPSIPPKELIDCKKVIYKYIHPCIYLDYYMFCATEQEMTELIFATSFAKLLNKIETENNSLIETTKALERELLIKNDEYIKKSNELIILQGKIDANDIKYKIYILFNFCLVVIIAIIYYKS